MNSQGDLKVETGLGNYSPNLVFLGFERENERIDLLLKAKFPSSSLNTALPGTRVEHPQTKS